MCGLMTLLATNTVFKMAPTVLNPALNSFGLVGAIKI